MKCRGCGKDNAVQGEEVEGLGFMHDKCEIRRLRNMHSELQAAFEAAEAERDIADKQLSVLCEGVNRRCGADNNQLPLVSLDKLAARLAAAEKAVSQYRLLAVSYGKTLRVSEENVDDIVTARLAQQRAAKGGRDGES